MSSQGWHPGPRSAQIEDFRADWNRFGGRPALGPDDPFELPDPQPGRVEEEAWDPIYYGTPADFPGVTTESPPLPGEDFPAWRDRALWDFIRPDLTETERVAYFRERLDRVGWSANLRPGFGRFVLRVNPPSESQWPALEEALVADRIAAGDFLIESWREGRGSWNIYPPLPRLHRHNDKIEYPEWMKTMGRRKL